MDNTSYNIRIPKRWVRVSMIVAVTALIVAPLSAVASHTFTDVPTSNTHHDDITWLRDADVTRGCNPPANTRYCPDDFVTRAQMASFLERLATNQVVDAGTLDGREASGIVSLTGNRATGTPEVDVSGVTKIEEINVATSDDGLLFITGNSTWRSQNTASNILVWLQLNNTTCNNGISSVRSIGWGYASPPGEVNLSSLSIDGPIAVSAGNHTVTLCANPFDGNLTPSLFGGSIQAIFVGEGSIATGIASGSGGTLPGTSG